MKKQTVALVLAVALVIGCSMGGTMAWLTSQSDKVTNVFTTSDIDITLDESALNEDGLTLDTERRVTSNDNYKMIPGWTIEKDPVVTVKTKSEDAWVFIKVEESGGDVKVGGTVYTFDDFIAYKIDTNNWVELDDEKGVYYTKYENRDDVDILIKILAGGTYTDPMGTEDYTNDDVTVAWEANQVAVKPSVTKEMMNALEADGANKPTLTFTAYATQLYKDNDTEFSAAEAWQKVKPEEGTGGTTN